jgi:hypothetical protein
MIGWSIHILGNNPWTNRGSSFRGVKVSADLPVEVTLVEGADFGLQNKTLKRM